MRRYFVTFALAGLALAAVVAAAPSVGEETSTAAAPVAVQRVSMEAYRLRDEAAMVLVGTALIGLAAAVRRAA